MPTVNKTVTSNWTKVADDTDTTVLIQCIHGVPWEIAAVATDTQPTITGHIIKGDDQTITRSTIGSGFLYARTKGVAQATFVVTLSTD